MKKVFILGIAAVCALLVFSCDAFGPGDYKPVYNDKGQRMVELSLSVGQPGRALTTDLAQGYTNYYEVAFKFGADYYRIAWRAGDDPKIYVPVGTYTSTGAPADTNTALLFAGRVISGKPVLLATGVLDSGSTNISAVTAAVTFNLTALTADVATPGTITAVPAATDGRPATVSAQFNINGTTRDFLVRNIDKATATTLTYALTAPNSAGVIVKGNGTFSSERVLSTDPAVGGVTIPSGSITLTPDIAFSGTFDIVVTSADEYCLAAISFEIPVCPISTSESYPGIWYMRGGILNSEYDTGLLLSPAIPDDMRGGRFFVNTGTGLAGITIITTW